MADTIYDTDHLAKPLLVRERSPSSTATHHVRASIRSTIISLPSAISWNAALASSSSSDASQRFEKTARKLPQCRSLSLQLSCRGDNCPHNSNEHSKPLANRDIN